MRKLGIAIVVVIVLVVIAALVLPHFLDVNSYRGQIQAQLQQKLGRPVTLGDMTLSLMPPSVRVANVVIGEDPSVRTGKPFAVVQELYVSVKLLPLLAKDVEISSLELQRPQIEMVKSASGKWNFSTLGQPAQQQAQGPQQPQQPSQTKPQQTPSTQGQAEQKKFELAEMKITDGQVAITDLEKRSPRAVYDHIDATLNDYAQGKPFSLDLAAHLPGNGKQLVRLEGKGGPLNDATPMNTPFDGELKL